MRQAARRRRSLASPAGGPGDVVRELFSQAIARERATPDRAATEGSTRGVGVTY
jgi:hypothetical protein